MARIHKEHSQICASKQLIRFSLTLELLNLVIEGRDLSITEDNFVPTARCNQDTKKRYLVTRSCLQRLRCFVCHLHHEQATRALYRVRQFFMKSTRESTSLQSLCHCWRCQCCSIQVRQEARIPRLIDLLSCRHVERNATGGQHWTPI